MRSPDSVAGTIFNAGVILLLGIAYVVLLAVGTVARYLRSKLGESVTVATNILSRRGQVDKSV